MAAETTNKGAARACETHGLIAADDGKCVLCRRADRPSALVAPRQETAGDRIVTVVLLLCMLGAVGALIWLVRQPRPVSHTGTNFAVEEPAPTAPPEVVPAGDAALVDAGVTTAAPPATDPVAQAAAKVSAARQARVTEARAKVKVRMFATRWCSICDAARFYLDAAGVEFTELRIDEDDAAAKALSKLNPQSTVPTFTVGDQVFIGYNPYDLEAAIVAAAREGAGLAPEAAPQPEPAAEKR